MFFVSQFEDHLPRDGSLYHRGQRRGRRFIGGKSKLVTNVPGTFLSKKAFYAAGLEPCGRKT
jgi:hypothetical protein